MSKTLLPLPTKQELFDAAVKGMRKQKAFSVRGDGDNPEGPNCLYRNALGHKCAFGHWIPDSSYSSEFEGGCKASHVLRELCGEIFTGEFACFVDNLQRSLHDRICAGSFNADKFEQAAVMFANEYNLIYTPPTE